MTKLFIDIISDIHTDTRHDFDWSYQPTSPNCIVLGDVASDLATVVGTLEHLATVYQHVFYIDGNSEHEGCLDNLGHSYRALQASIEHIENVTYLQDNVVIINGIAIVATNGWFTYDFDHTIQTLDAISEYAQEQNVADEYAAMIYKLAATDAGYLVNSIKRLQRHLDVRTIMICTHTVPRRDLIAHDRELVASQEFKIMGNSIMRDVLKYDVERKVKYWLFGHYHGTVDREIDGVRYLCNSQGKNGADDCVYPYYPRRIEIDF